MKNSVLFPAILFLAGLYTFMPPVKSLEGHWTVTYPGGQKMTVEFKKNGPFVAVIRQKILEWVENTN